MKHEQRWHVEVLKEIEHPDGNFHEPHPTPLLHAALEPADPTDGPPTTEDHAGATTYEHRGDLLMHLEQLRERHPDARFAIRHVVTNVEAWPPLETGGYPASPNDLRYEDLEKARAKAAGSP